MNLEQWAKRVFRDIDSEGSCARSVQLTSKDGTQTWSTWNAPFGDPQEWAEEATALVAELADEWPTREHVVHFVALDGNNQVRDMCPRTVKGKSRSATSASGSETAALASTFDQQARTTQTLLDACNTQVRVLSETNEMLATRLHEALDFLIQRKNDILIAQEPNKDDDGIGLQIYEDLKPHLPMLLQLLQSMGVNPPTSTATPTPTPTATVSNGAPAS